MSRSWREFGIPKGGNKDCATVVAVQVLPVGYVVSASGLLTEE